MSIRNEKVTTGKFVVIIPLIFVIIGLVMTFFAFKMKADNENFMKTAVEVPATCTNVWFTTSTDDDGDTTYSYHADVEYEYEGTKYTAKDMGVTEDTVTGNVIRVYIDPNNPSDARYEYGAVEFTLQLVIGIIMTVIGLAVTIGFLTAIKKQNAAVDAAQPWER